MTIRALLYIALINAVFLPSSLAWAQDDTDARIRGVANFLLDRANDNFFYLLETRIKRNNYLRCYFPKTYDYAASGDLKVLLRSGGSVWKHSVQDDIDHLSSQIIIKFLVLNNLTDKAIKLLDQYIQFTSHVEIKLNGNSYALNANIIGGPDKKAVNEIVNSFYPFSSSAYGTLYLLQKLEISTTKMDDDDDTECAILKLREDILTGEDESDIRDFIPEFIGALISLEEAFQMHKSKLRIKKSYMKKKFNEQDELNKILKSLTQLKLDLDKYKNYLKFIEKKIKAIKAIKTIDKKAKKDAVKKNNYFIQVRLAEQILKYKISPDAKESVLKIDPDSEDYRRFRKYIVFFAEVADANDDTKVKALLEELTLPPVSFGIKRTPGENRWMITSYLGAAAGREDRGQDTKSYAGMFAPIGLEWTFYRFWNRSLSVMIAPFDFAHPLNLEVDDKEEAVGIDDIVVPGLYFSMGWKNSPITTGIGYSKGRALRSDADEEARVMLFIAFDMPLFSFH